MPAILMHHDGPIARIKLNRPEVRNAINDELIAELADALKAAERNPTIRVVILSGEGDFFCAGADLNWMKSFVGASRKKNEADALKFARLLQSLNELGKPTIAQVHGAAIGGGVGLLAACDVVVAFENTVFALAEVKLGLVPAVISPFVIARMGASAARRYFLTGERFTSDVALRLGLVHEVVPMERLETVANEIARHLLSSGPEAVKHAKELIRVVGRGQRSAVPTKDPIQQYTVKKIAALRASPEAQEGMKAFLEKRKPNWNVP
ncbi:MAG TPA: enoyl-CoA hydratase-related protein [bacterium]|nr:enoyl-CoA hydratase-related protein [bacterium]